MKTLAPIIVAVVAFAPVAVWLELQAASDEPVPPERTERPAGEAQHPSTGDPRETSLIGVIVPAKVVELAARSEGRVQRVEVQLGDRVARGSVIARMDDAGLRDELSVARAALRAAEADRDKAQSELEAAKERQERRAKINQRGSSIISDEELAESRYQEKYAASALQVALARIEERRAQVSALERRVADTVIIAPFPGSIASLYVGDGASVATGTHIARIVADELLVRFAATEDASARTRAGLRTSMRVENIDRPIAIVIARVSPEIDAASRMLIAEATIDVPAELAGTPLIGRVAHVALPHE